LVADYAFAGEVDLPPAAAFDVATISVSGSSTLIGPVGSSASMFVSNKLVPNTLEGEDFEMFVSESGGVADPTGTSGAEHDIDALRERVLVHLDRLLPGARE
jgi:hypothetical protein